MWVSTEYQERDALVNYLCQDISLFCARGNLIWFVSEGNLFYYEIQKNGDFWEHKKTSEENFTLEQTSCPLSYLDKTEEKNKEWREKVCNNFNSIKSLREELREAFVESKKSNYDILITVKTQQGDLVLVMEDIVPLLGRNRGKLYRIPLRRIHSWEKKLH
jgi:hypothetical protein